MIGLARRTLRHVVEKEHAGKRAASLGAYPREVFRKVFFAQLLRTGAVESPEETEQVETREVHLPYPVVIDDGEAAGGDEQIVFRKVPELQRARELERGGRERIEERFQFALVLPAQAGDAHNSRKKL